MQASNDNPTASATLNGEKLQAFPLRSTTVKGRPVSPLLFNIVVEVLDRAIGQEKKKLKGCKLERRESYFLFAEDIIQCIGKLKDATKKALICPSLVKLQNVKSTQRSISFRYTEHDMAERGQSSTVHSSYKYKYPEQI